MAVPSKITLWKKNDQYIEISGLKNQISDVYLNAATVTATLKSRDGQAVAGFDSVTLIYVTGSDGQYRGQIEETFDPPVGGGYTLYLDAAEDGATYHVEIPCEVKVRKS